MRQNERTKGVVLRRFRSGEADRVLVIFTRDLGKLKASARAVRRTSSKLGGHLEPLQESKLALAKGRGEWWTVTGASLATSFSLGLDAMGRASRAAELTEAFMPELEPHPEVYDAFIRLMESLSAEGDSANLLDYEWRLFQLAGLAPELGRCVVCEGPLAGSGLAFSGERGGVAHRGCLGVGEGATPISSATLEDLRRVEAGETAQTIDEVAPIWDYYVSHTLKRAPRSQKLGVGR